MYPEPTVLELFRELIGLVVYELLNLFFWLIVVTYLREFRVRGLFNVPKDGPVIFVIAPHHSQFFDGAVVMTTIRETGRRPAFIIANKLYQLKFIGGLAKLMQAIPVERAQDVMKPQLGKIRVDPHDPYKLIGEGTKFTHDVEVKGLIGLPGGLGTASVESIEDDTHLTLRKPFTNLNPKLQAKADLLLAEGTLYKAAPHIDNHQVFENVFKHLAQGKTLGIFPEGGSHDRPDLLPLKPGVAIMALGTVATQLQAGITNPKPVKIVPMGLNYFHAHKFRLRAVVEFGTPITVTKEMAEDYILNLRDTTSKLLSQITYAMKEVVVACKDYDTLVALQAARRLFTLAQRELIPLPLVMEMNRRLIRGYEEHADEPDVIKLKRDVIAYNKRLMRLGLHDHQVELLTETNKIATLANLIGRFIKFFTFASLCMPGTIMFAPVFILGKIISQRKARQALAALTVKIKANDVIATWKVLVALGVAPILYVFYLVIGCYIISLYHIEPLALCPTVVQFVVCYAFALLITYSLLRFGEVGVDYYKSLAPLFILLVLSSFGTKIITNLQRDRRNLLDQVQLFVAKYGPDMFDDFDQFYREYNGVSDYEVVAKPRPSPSDTLLRTHLTGSANAFGLDNLSDVQIWSNPAPKDDDSDDVDEALTPEAALVTGKDHHHQLANGGDGDDEELNLRRRINKHHDMITNSMTYYS